MSNNIRKEIDGEFQYKAIVKNADGSAASATEFSDWFVNDEAAQKGFAEIMNEQGYQVSSVEILFPLSVVTLS